MKTKRPLYRYKWQWAEAKAQGLREQASQVSRERIPSSDWRNVRSKMRVLDSLGRDAGKYERMAERFKEAGI